MLVLSSLDVAALLLGQRLLLLLPHSVADEASLQAGAVWRRGLDDGTRGHDPHRARHLHPRVNDRGQATFVEGPAFARGGAGRRCTADENDDYGTGNPRRAESDARRTTRAPRWRSSPPAAVFLARSALAEAREARADHRARCPRELRAHRDDVRPHLRELPSRSRRGTPASSPRAVTARASRASLAPALPVGRASIPTPYRLAAVDRRTLRATPPSPPASARNISAPRTITLTMPARDPPPRLVPAQGPRHARARVRPRGSRRRLGHVPLRRDGRRPTLRREPVRRRGRTPLATW